MLVGLSVLEHLVSVDLGVRDNVGIPNHLYPLESIFSNISRISFATSVGSDGI